tara:strand:- start:2168 stop:2674 length:507 start_codon:yes stop_codon:yes gene_type:complete
MSRYRPPSPLSSPYITAAGAARLRKELLQLWNVERPLVTATVHDAAKNGDRSENGDYIYGKRRLREIDSRVRYLTARLENITIVDQAPADQGRVYFGAWITVVNDEGEQSTYRIVGGDEIDPARGYISVDSPMARALLGKTGGQDIEFGHMEQQHRFRLVVISYQTPD